MVRQSFIVGAVAVLFVILGIFFGYQVSSTGKENSKVEQEFKKGLNHLTPVHSKDHILGRSDAPVHIITFSETECPYCKELHFLLKEVYEHYSDEEKVAIVHRHFPLDDIHPKGRITAHALECASELGGNAVFWKYLDELYTTTPSNNNLDLSELPRIAESVGLDRNSFIDCQKNRDFTAIINQNLGEALITGGTIRPWSILVTDDDHRASFVGIPNKEVLITLIDRKLKK